MLSIKLAYGIVWVRLCLQVKGASVAWHSQRHSQRSWHKKKMALHRVATQAHPGHRPSSAEEDATLKKQLESYWKSESPFLIRCKTLLSMSSSRLDLMSDRCTLWLNCADEQDMHTQAHEAYNNVVKQVQAQILCELTVIKFLHNAQSCQILVFVTIIDIFAGRLT